jgi:capsular exopolysaccharide synthesis family protein
VSPRTVLSALRAGWWLIAFGALVGGLVAVAVSITMTPMYTATTQLFVSTTGTGSASEIYQGGQFSQQRVASYAQLLEGEELSARVVDSLQLALRPEELADKIEATTVPNTVLLSVSVTDASPEMAHDLAAAVGTEFIDMVEELETSGDSGSSPVRVTVSQRPEVPDEPSSPQTPRNIVVGALAGLLAGAALAVARARLDRSVKDPEDAAGLANAPVIGSVPRDAVLTAEHTIDRSPGSGVAESFRQLRNNLQFLSVDEPPKVIMVSSAVADEGKTTLAVNLALALTDAGRSVTLVEADLRRPKVTRYLGMVSGAGLTNVLAGTADLDDVTQQYGKRDLVVLAAGPTPPNPGELLASSQMSALVNRLRGRSDFLILDAPPLLPVADSSGLAVHVDGVLMSVRHGSTKREELDRAARMVEMVGAKLLGVVMNIVPPREAGVGAYRYGYQDAYADVD